MGVCCAKQYETKNGEMHQQILSGDIIEYCRKNKTSMRGVIFMQDRFRFKKVLQRQRFSKAEGILKSALPADPESDPMSALLPHPNQTSAQNAALGAASIRKPAPDQSDDQDQIHDQNQDQEQDQVPAQAQQQVPDSPLLSSSPSSALRAVSSLAPAAATVGPSIVPSGYDNPIVTELEMKRGPFNCQRPVDDGVKVVKREATASQNDAIYTGEW